MEWTQNRKVIDSIQKMPPSVYGFIYKITISYQGKIMWYIGKKQLISRRKKKMTKKEIAAMKNKRQKKWYWIEKEMDWRNYTGSNKELNDIIKKEGEGSLKMSKEILCYGKCKEELKYLEAKEIICSDGLLDEDCFNNGVSIRVFGKVSFS